MNVRDVANLARIELSDEEASRYQEQMDQILHYVEQLNQIDVEGISPAYFLQHHNDYECQGCCQFGSH